MGCSLRPSAAIAGRIPSNTLSLSSVRAQGASWQTSHDSGDFDKCEAQFVKREAGGQKEPCMISEKVKKGKEPEWVKYRKKK